MVRELYYIDDENIFLVDDTSGKVKPVNLGEDMNITRLKPEIAQKLVTMIMQRRKNE